MTFGQNVFIVYIVEDVCVCVPWGVIQEEKMRLKCRDVHKNLC